MRHTTLSSTLLLTLTAFIWGMCFVAQRSGMDYIGPFLFNGLRELLGALTLLIGLAAGQVVTHLRHQHKRKPVATDTWRSLVVSGTLCGLVLYFASNLQQIGMVYESASKAAFITTLYIVLVPLLGLAFRQKISWNSWVSVALAACGLYLLCVSETLRLGSGDILLLICAFFWAIHILLVGHFAPRFTLRQLLRFCVIQFAVAGVLSLVSAPVLDTLFVTVPLSVKTLGLVAPEILYAGILSTGLAFTLAALGQRYAKPQSAAVIMSLEAVFGLLGGFVLLGESLSAHEALGSLLMFGAVVLTQLTFKPRLRRRVRDG
ncbi:MAG: DMT family transporter [Coriobacteriales bacterium]|jgi:drug/metabolite transporter (DMT)-like permease|nr:DMT family transporter [Coriobacteriales bacterium]